MSMTLHMEAQLFADSQLVMWVLYPNAGLHDYAANKLS